MGIYPRAQCSLEFWLFYLSRTEDISISAVHDLFKCNIVLYCSQWIGAPDVLIRDSFYSFDSRHI